LKAAGTPQGANRYLRIPALAAGGWAATLGTTGGLAIAYFLAARLGLALLYAPSDLAVFWPASGIAAGTVIALGRRDFPALVIGVVVGTVAASLMSDRNLLTSLFNGFWNAGEALLVVWLLERWFGQSFTFGDLPHVAGFLVAAGIATAASAIGGAATMTLLHSDTTAPYWHVWREWFLSSWVGLVVIAPLVIGLAQVWRTPPTRKEWIEGVGVLSLTAVACSVTMTQKTGSWVSFSPGAFVLPLLLWLTARFQPAFGIVGAFVACSAIISATTLGIGRFGDAAVPIAERVAGARLAMMLITNFTLVLAVLFAQRKRAEEGLRESEGQLAKKSAALARLHEVGSRLWVKRDLHQALDEILAGAIELMGADMGAIRIWNSERGSLKIEAHRGFTCEYLDLFRQIHLESTPPCDNVLRSGERMVIEDVEQDYRFAPFRPLARAAGYRALQSTRILSREGVPLGVLGTHFRSVHKPSDQDLHLLDLYVRQAADIIEHHKVHNALCESEERLRLAQLKTGVGVWDWDLRADKVTWTPELAAIYGVEPGYMKCYANFRDRVHPDDIEVMRANQEAAVQRGETFRNDFRIIRPDGKVRWLSSVGGAVYDAATGKPNRILGNNVDITERKEAEIALAERNTQLELASKTAQVGTFVMEFHTGLVKLSPGCASIFGLPEGTAEISREYGLTLVHPEDLPRLELRRNQAFLKQQREFVAQYRIRRVDDGQVRWMEVRGLNFYGRDGQPSRAIAIIIDFTERKLAEEMLAERNAQLALAAKSARVGCYANNLETGLITVSEGYAAIHGLPEGTAQTTLSQWRTRVHPDDLAPFDELRERLFGNRQHDYMFDYRIFRDDGEIRWIESRGCVSYNEDGRPQQCVGINMDVTDRKQTEARLSDALAAGQVVAFEWDAITGRSQRSENAADILGSGEGLVASSRGTDFLHHIHPDDRASLKTRICALRPSDPSYVLSFRYVRPDTRQVWLEEIAKGEFDAAGKLLRIKGLTRDITDRKCAEERQRVLVAELDHRVKNMLATVSAIASRTRETSSSIDNFAAALDGRIKAMAITHELLSQRRWQGIPLAELIRRELAPYATAENTHISGPNVVLSAQAGETLAVVFHELATNAAKFGASSVKSGRISVRWNFKHNVDAESWLCIDWEETGGPHVVPSARSGFGTNVVRELVPYELGGTVDLMYLPEGVRCKLEIPADRLS
jgi:PAS domain S-box-containing protein